MPKASVNVLATDREVKAAKTVTARTDFRIRGAPGLQLRVTDAGTKSWSLAYKSPATGKWAKIALGQYDAVGLAEAKSKSADLASEIRRGKDPIHDKRQEALAETFEMLALRYMREHEVRNARDGKRSRSTIEAQRQLDHDILPLLGRIRSEAVTRHQVMQVVEAIADRGSYVAADRALGLVRAIYNWACGTGRLDLNPTLGLRKRNTMAPKTRVLSANEIRAFWRIIGLPSLFNGYLRAALRLQLLTGARIGEVIGAGRSEFDLEAGVWTIPAVRTKAEREHVLPLSVLARQAVADAIALGDQDESTRAERAGRASQAIALVFPSPRGGGVMDPHVATRAILREREAFAAAGISATFNTHDLRRTMATQLGEMETPDEIIERILNHAPRTVAGKHYNHARYLGPMRQALDAWAERLQGIVAGQTHEPGESAHNERQVPHER